MLQSLIRVEAYPRGGKRKSAMSSLVKSQETYVSHRGAAESRIRSICRGSSEEERSPDKREVGMSQFPLGTTGEGASAFDLFKKAPSFKENVSGNNRQISFSMAP